MSAHRKLIEPLVEVFDVKLVKMHVSGKDQPCCLVSPPLVKAEGAHLVLQLMYLGAISRCDLYPIYDALLLFVLGDETS